MRTVVLFIAMSLDGYIAEMDGSIGWLTNDLVMEEEDHTYDEFYKTVDTVILGRTTYDQVVNELSLSEYPYDAVMNYIITSRVEPETTNRKFVKGDVVSLVKQLKVEDGKKIWSVGGNSIIMPLLENDLIDEFQIAVIPTILGKGISLFSNVNHMVNLKLESSFTKKPIVYLNDLLDKK